jgi:hypothetical protein
VYFVWVFIYRDLKKVVGMYYLSLTERGFSTKNRDKVNDDRLGIKLSFK